MRLQYLGTAASEGWPALFCNCEHCLRAFAAGGRNIRTRSHALVDGRLSIDLPADAYMHILKEKLKPWEWTAFIFTHTHSDHFHPAELINVYPPFGHGKAKATVFGNEGITAALRPMLEKRDPEGEQLKTVTVEPFKSFTHEKYRVTPLKADHDRAQSCFIYIICDGEKALLYANDTGYFPEETWERINGTRFDLVSLDCTYGVNPGKRDGHMSLDVCGEVKERLLASGCDGGTKFVVNHFSHNGAAIYDEMSAAAAEYGMETSYDGMIIDF